MVDVNVIDADLLSRSTFFAAFGPHRVHVAGLLRVRTLLAGELLMDVGEPGDMMYVVLEGALRVTLTSAPDAPILDTLGPGEAVGEMALLLGETRSAACRAAVESKVGALAKSDFDDLLSRDPSLAIALGRLVAQRLRRTNQIAVPAVPSLLATQMLLLGGTECLTLGRDPTNQVVLTAPAIAPFQVEIIRNGEGRYMARNLDEANGMPLVVNSRLTLQAPVADGDTLVVGPYRFILFETLGTRDEHVGSVWLKAERLSVVRNGSTLLNDVSLAIRPGEFVAITGSSGTGKSTLLNALNGFRPATTGRVTINGVALYDHMDIFRHTVGYVPQDDIVHPELTVRGALGFTARLRQPFLSREEMQWRLTHTLQLLRLTEQQDQPIGSLSGGQRKRASIGVELITEPSLFCLDEPTSGLDPASEVRMMALLRQISQRGQTVVMVTHATETIGMCDRVIFLARGGRLAFAGTPLDALAHFRVTEFDAIYHLLEHEQTPTYWEEYFHRSRNAPAMGGTLSGGPIASEESTAQVSRRKVGVAYQFPILLQRYVEISRHDTRTLTLVALQAPLIALLMWVVFPRDVFSPNPQLGHGRATLMILFILVAAAIFFGASNASKELVKERAIFRRERLVNLGLVPYLLSKVCVLGVIGIVQSVLLVGLCALGGLLPPTVTPAMVAALVGVLSLTFLAGASLGLLLSALASNPDFATSMVPLILLPQLMFSGVLTPPPSRTVAVSFQLSDWLAQATVAKWALELLGHVTGLIDVLGAQNSSVLLEYKDAFAGAGWWPHVTVLTGLVVLFLGGTLIALESKAQLP